MARVFNTNLTISDDMKARLASIREPTEEELRAQCVSWVYGNLWESDKTKDQIRQSIAINRLVPPARRKVESACGRTRRGHRRDGGIKENR